MFFAFPNSSPIVECMETANKWYLKLHNYIFSKYEIILLVL